MSGRKNVNMRVARRNRRQQQELDAKRDERQTPQPEGTAPSRYRAKKSKKSGGSVAVNHPRRHLRRLERENYIPAIGAAD